MASIANAIPGYEDAVKRERQARNVIYIAAKEIICGVRVNNITPRTLAILTEAESPFLFGGSYDHTHAAQFIAALQDDEERDMGSVLETLLALEIEDIADDIAEFIALTFLDAPSGGTSEEAPIASGIAWLEFRFACKPFNWDYDTRTANVPLRRLYQLLRCNDKFEGAIVTNALSGKAEGDWLDNVNAELKRDPEGTRAKLEEVQMRAACARAGIEYGAHLIPRKEAQ